MLVSRCCAEIARGASPPLPREFLVTYLNATVVTSPIGVASATPTPFTTGGYGELGRRDSRKSTALEKNVPSDQDVIDKASTAIDKYYGVQQLDSLPSPVYVPALDSEEMLGTWREELVEVLLSIETDGSVSDVEIISGSPLFADRVRQGFLRAVFWPGRKNGQSVSSKIVIQIGYPEVGKKNPVQSSR